MYAEVVMSRSSRVQAGVHGSAFSPVGILRIGDWPEHDSDDAGGLAIYCRDPEVWEALASLCLHLRAQLILPADTTSSGLVQDRLPLGSAVPAEVGPAEVGAA